MRNPIYQAVPSGQPSSVMLRNARLAVFLYAASTESSSAEVEHHGYRVVVFVIRRLLQCRATRFTCLSCEKRPRRSGRLSPFSTSSDGYRRFTARLLSISLLRRPFPVGRSPRAVDLCFATARGTALRGADHRINAQHRARPDLNLESGRSG